MVRRYGLWGVSLLCSLSLGGCVVPKDEYDLVMTNLEGAQAELEQTRMEYESLEREHTTLQADHEQAAIDLETLSAEIQQVKESHSEARDLLAAREAELQKDRQAISSKLQDLQQVFQKLKSQNRALRDTVSRYKKELKAAREAPSMVQAPKVKKPEAPVDSSPPPASGAVPFNGTVKPVNINTASANDLELFLGLSKELAEKVVSNRPYRLRGELLAKQVVPQATFDVIKDRITAAPQ